MPAAHSVHEPLLGPDVPALQVHAVAAVLPAGDVLEAGHPPHAALPACSLYVPAAHSVHAPPFAPVYPALQMHATTDELCAGELESWGHASHTLFNVYVPAPHSAQGGGPTKPALQVHADTSVLPTGADAPSPGQELQAAGPCASLYLPAAHGSHTKSS